MNWKHLRRFPWVDTRARFVNSTPASGSLLDIGSSDGETLNHFAELRPDLKLFSTDLEGTPEKYPRGCEFFRANVQTDKMPWPDASMDRIICTHLVEHLISLDLLFAEMARLLKPGGRVYVETPHPKTLVLSSPIEAQLGRVAVNFYDDRSHTKPLPLGALAQFFREARLQVIGGGVSRNWLFAAAYPFYFFAPSSRKKSTARLHWIGWSAYVIAHKPKSGSDARG
jgi:SAM-dependent methyltransferase